jgi:hypothetical protein
MGTSTRPIISLHLSQQAQIHGRIPSDFYSMSSDQKVAGSSPARRATINRISLDAHFNRKEPKRSRF